MRAASILLVTLVAAAGFYAPGCAPTAGSTTDAFVVPIEVDNNLTGLSGASIYINRSTGTSRRLLGPVEAGKKRTFEYDARAGFYRLIARRAMSDDSIVSDTFQLQPGTMVQWSIPMNRLLTGSR